MKIFVIADIHGEEKYLEKAEELIKASDLVVIAGDIAKTGKAVSAIRILDRIEKMNRSILAVHGNWDRGEVLDLLEEKNYSLHANGKIIDDIAFFGVGGSPITMMNTETEYNEEEMYEFLKCGYERIKHSKKIVLVSHTPPWGIRDETYLKLKGGSSSVRDFIRENKVDLCISGHIHEAHGIEQYKTGIVVNTGSFKKGRYGIVTIDGDISVETARFKRGLFSWLSKTGREQRSVNRT